MFYGCVLGYMNFNRSKQYIFTVRILKVSIEPYFFIIITVIFKKTIINRKSMRITTVELVKSQI